MRLKTKLYASRPSGARICAETFQENLSSVLLWISGKLYVEKCFQWSKELLTWLYSEEIGFLYSVNLGLEEGLHICQPAIRKKGPKLSIKLTMKRTVLVVVKWINEQSCLNRTLWWPCCGGAMPRFVSCMKFVRSNPNIGHLMHSIKTI